VRGLVLLRVLLPAVLLLCPNRSFLSAASDDPIIEKPADAFFAGTVVETTPEKITVTRRVLGKAENHTFIVTQDTKVEGKLRVKIRVTVRYVPNDDGDTATMIVVRSGSKKK